MSTGDRKSRPNSNYVLQVMRDGDMSDPWGTAMAWGFACAENLNHVGERVPTELQYSPSPLGSVIESYEDFTVAEYLGADVDHETETVNWALGCATISDDVFKDRVAEVQFAARCLSRYLDWCKAAGLDY